MMYRGRIYYNAEQKAEMWDRWQKGESLNAIGGFLIDLLLRFLISYLRVVVFVRHRDDAPGWRWPCQSEKRFQEALFAICLYVLSPINWGARPQPLVVKSIAMVA
jgi:hypothetical protein